MSPKMTIPSALLIMLLGLTTTARSQENQDSTHKNYHIFYPAIGKDILRTYMDGHDYKLVSIYNKVTELYVDNRKVAENEWPKYNAAIEKIKATVKSDDIEEAREMEQAHRDREQDQRDREQAEREREQARRDREKAVREREQQERDRDRLERDRDRSECEREQAQREQQQMQHEQEQMQHEQDQVQREQDQVQREEELARREGERAQREADQAQREAERAERDSERDQRRREQNFMYSEQDGSGEQDGSDPEQDTRDRQQAADDRAMIKEMIQSLVDKNIIPDAKSLKNLEYTDTTLIVNGTKQPQQTHQEIKELCGKWALSGLSYGCSQDSGTIFFSTRTAD